MVKNAKEPAPPKQPTSLLPVAEAGGTSRSKPTRPFNLKGKDAIGAVGQCVQVLYDEGGSGLVPYFGVVVYVERHRCVQPSRPVHHLNGFRPSGPPVSGTAV